MAFDMLNIAIIGYGKMGHEIEQIAKERGHNVCLVVDADNLNDLNADNLAKVDVALEFTSPLTAYSNVISCINSSTPVVCGTTGWNDKLAQVIDEVKAGKGTFFYASNFSIGMNVFFKINAIAAEYFSKIDGYGVEIKEVHHNQKKDAPSGTAIAIADIITKRIDGIEGWTLLPERSEDKIPIEAVRMGSIPGIHNVTYESEFDSILLSHQAKGRRGLALGAVLAAEFVAGKKGFFSMDDLLKL